MRRMRKILRGGHASDSSEGSDDLIGIHRNDTVPLISKTAQPRLFRQKSRPFRGASYKSSKYRGNAKAEVPLGIQPSPFVVSHRRSKKVVKSGRSRAKENWEDCESEESRSRIPHVSPASSQSDTDNITVSDDCNSILDSSIACLRPSSLEVSPLQGPRQHHQKSDPRTLGEAVEQRNTFDTESPLRKRNYHVSDVTAETHEMRNQLTTPTKTTPQRCNRTSVTPPPKPDSPEVEDSNTSGNALAPNLGLQSTSPQKVPHGSNDKRRRKPGVRIKDPRISFSRRKKITSLEVNETSNDVVTDEPLIKIFLLLLQPKAKVFELIQLLYPPSVTTIGDIIDLIPLNATEKALGSQKYVGLTRPRRRSKEITNLTLMASNENDRLNVGITQGEILIAIPENYTARYMIGLSKQILSNSKIRTLLEKSTSGCTSTVDKRPMEAVEEEPADQSQEIEEVLNRARYAAAETNASPTVSPEELKHLNTYGVGRDFPVLKPERLFAFNGSYLEKDDLSLQGSYSSWSRSFDSSVTSGGRSMLGYSKAPDTATKRNRRRGKQVSTVAKVVAAGGLFMVVRYIMDPKPLVVPSNPDTAMGLLGFLQFSFFFALLVRLQREAKKKLLLEKSQAQR